MSSAVAPSPTAAPLPPTDGVVVHLLGWTGAQKRHVEKYADAWKSLPGMLTTVVEADHCPMGVSELWSPSKFDALGAALCDRLVAYPSRCTVVLHVFSNGGATLFAALAKAMHDREAFVNIAALVFDSCPGSFRSIPAGFNFLWESQRSVPMRGAIVACSPLLALACGLGLAASLRIDGWRVTDMHARYIDSVLLYATHHHKSPPLLQVLFLYSKDVSQAHRSNSRSCEVLLAMSTHIVCLLLVCIGFAHTTSRRRGRRAGAPGAFHVRGDDQVLGAITSRAPPAD